MKSKLDEMKREAQEGAERARKLRERLEEATASVDDLVVEARSTLRRAVEFLEREGLRGKKSGMIARIDAGKDAAPKGGVERSGEPPEASPRGDDRS